MLPHLLALGYSVKALTPVGNVITSSSISTIVAVGLDGAGSEHNVTRVLNTMDRAITAAGVQHHGIIVQGEQWVTWRPGNVLSSEAVAPAPTPEAPNPRTSTLFDHLTKE